MSMAGADISHSRKDDHVRLATAQADLRQSSSDFDGVRFIHHALRAADIAEVTTEAQVFGDTWSCPLYINAMTGGTEATGKINEGLARVAHRTGIPIASGSMSRVLKYPDVAGSYRVLRSENPHGIVFANLSANATVAEAQFVVDLVEADALQVHINSAQEVVMPEGDRKFSHWVDNIFELTSSLEVPIIVKEVGFGISQETLTDLIELGVSAVDISGRGGTNFARIETTRREAQRFSAFDDWGITTPCSLLDVGQTAATNGVTVFASGGVRGPLDVARSLALGATAVGVAGGFLRTLLHDGEDALVTEIESWREQLKSLQSLLGATTPATLTNTSVLLTDGVREFCELRGIDAASYARRATFSTRRIHA